MRLTGRIENNPNYVLLSQYYDKEDVRKIIESGIAINQVDVVPSLMVPPGQGCEDLATQGLSGLGELLDAAPTGLTRNFLTGQLGDVSTFDIPLSTIGTPATQTVGMWETLTDLFKPRPAVVQTVGASSPHDLSATPHGSSDPALDWVEQNWLMIAAGLGVLLVLSVATKK